MQKLKRSPLQEVIFEVRWDLEVNPDDNQTHDPGFEMAAGVLKKMSEREFSFTRRKLPIGVPAEFMEYQTVHQYWKAENIWPVLQLGPGIFTINERENYTWDEHFFPLISKALEWLFEAYSNKITFRMVSLRYIDSIKVQPYGLEKWPEFIATHFNFSFQNQFDLKGELKKFQFTQVFDQDDNSELQLTISNGRNKQSEDILLWQTALVKTDEFTKEGLISWVQSAHNLSTAMFKEICKKHFYDSFS